MQPAPSRLVAYRFGPFRLDIAGRILERDGERVSLTPKVIDTLFVLVERARDVVTKEELMQTVWPDVTVVESGLTRNISALRKAIEEGEEGVYLETIPRRGYRFVGLVTREYADSSSAVAPLREPSGMRFGEEIWLWMTGLAVAATMILLTVVNVQRARPLPDPAVKIGDHLLYKLAPEEVVRAAVHYEQALTANPRSAAAHAGLSTALIYQSMLGVQSLAAVVPRAEAAAELALRIDPQLASAHHAHASVLMVKDWALSRAEAGFRRALELDPSSVQSRMSYAQLKLAMGDAKASLRVTEEALRLDPASPLLGAQYCRGYYYLRDYHSAAVECRKVLDREPSYALAHYYLALSLGFQNLFSEAKSHLRKSGLREGVLETDEAWLEARAGNLAPARRLLAARHKLVEAGRLDESAKILLAAVLSEMDQGFSALDAGVRNRAPEILMAELEPRFEAFHPDPRWRSFVDRLHQLTRK